jgi:hypothetical protein
MDSEHFVLFDQLLDPWHHHIGRSFDERTLRSAIPERKPLSQRSFDLHKDEDMTIRQNSLLSPLIGNILETFAVVLLTVDPAAIPPYPARSRRHPGAASWDDPWMKPLYILKMICIGLP